jgi:2-polyprenyl-6-methoxyphenol hydroxylase-like FAD-dependent oxidoreductase
VIIGADGIHSVVRTSLFGPDAPRFTGKIPDYTDLSTKVPGVIAMELPLT